MSTGPRALKLAEHARGSGVIVCVENMPPGVHPGSRMAELAELLVELDHPHLALALDTGHANLTATAAEETRAAGSLLATTHVHDNDGRQDSHEPPGPRHDRLAGLGASARFGRLPRPDSPGMHSPPPPKPRRASSLKFVAGLSAQSRPIPDRP